MANLTRELHKKNQALVRTREQLKVLGGLLPICSACKKIRNDQGYWQRLEEYIELHSEAEFSHSLCPDCRQRLYPEIYQERDDGSPSPGIDPDSTGD